LFKLQQKIIMAKTIKLLLILTFFNFSIQTKAQNSRRDPRKSSAAYSNPQRISFCGTASRCFEIRSGKLWAWGNNELGQLGDGTYTQRSSPVQIGNDSDWVMVRPGYWHTLGLKSDGTLWAWGYNSVGMFGDGTNGNSLTPKKIGTDNDWVNISAGTSFSLGLKSDGTLWGWGYNNVYQLGNGYTQTTFSPKQIGKDNKWVSVVAGRTFGYALRSDGTLWAWGENTAGKLGDGTTTNRSTPVQVGTDNKWVSMKAGLEFGMGMKSDGTLWAWGRNFSGQLGDGTNTDRYSPVQCGRDNDWVTFVASSHTSLAIKSDGSLWTWGSNKWGMLGNGKDIDENTPIKIGTDHNWVNLGAGASLSYAVKSDGSLWACGNNAHGGVGDGTYNNSRYEFIKISTDSKFVNISSGAFHSAGLKSDGTLWTWGYNYFGQLGDSSTKQKNNPVQIGKDSTWMSIALGANHSLGLKANGTLWAWGNNEKGQLGNGTTNNSTIPTQIGKDSIWASISAGGNHSLALKADGTLWAWGENSNGQLGDSSQNNRNKPVQVGKQYGWVSISAGNKHTIGLTSNGRLFAWGANDMRQLGDGSKTQRNKPVRLGGDSTWIAMSAGGFHNLGLKSDGTLWAWGNNDREQLGDGTTSTRNGPTKIGSETKWIAISAGNTHNIGLKSDGTLWFWGDNAAGQFKDSTSKSQTGFLQIGKENNWSKISAGGYHSMAIKPDGKTIWTLGNNCFGQLGNGNVSNCELPPPPSASDTTVCSKNSIVLTASGLGKLSWYDAASGGNYLGSGANFVTPKLTSSVTYYVQDSTFSPSASRTKVNVKVLPLPGLYATASDSSVCEGKSVVIQGSGAKSYSWSHGIIDNISFIPKSTETYILTGTDSNFCVDSVSITIRVKKLPNVTANMKDSFVCRGTFILLHGKGAKTYTWSGGIKDSVEFMVDSSFTYQVTGSDTNQCINSSSVKISVKSLPKVSAISSSGTVCKGLPVTLTGSGAISYTWSFGVNNGISFTPDSTNRYRVMGKGANTCSDTASVLVIVNPLPSIKIASSQNYCCDEGNLALGNSKFASPTGGNWSCTNNSNIITANVFNTSLACDPKKDVNFTLVYTYLDPATSCFNKDSTIFTVHPLPDVKTNLIGNELSATQSGAIYQWLDCQKNYESIPGETKQTFTPSKNGDYAVIVNFNNCSDTSECININTIGLDKPSKINSLIIFPNPSTGELFIRSDNFGTYKIINELGQTMRSFDLNSSNNYSIRLENLSSGIYFITRTNNHQITHQKIVVIN